MAWEVSEHLADLAAGNARVDRATDQATTYWERLYGDDELLVSLPGMGPVTRYLSSQVRHRVLSSFG